MNLTLWSYCASFTAVIESSSQSAGEERESSPGLMLNHGTNLHRTLPKTHVPVFRGMVVTYPLLNKANFLIKQETIWCCICSFLLTPALCVFWNHAIIHQWHCSFSDEETGIYCTVLWCTPRATCDPGRLSPSLCAWTLGSASLICAQPGTSPACGCSRGSYGWNHFSLKSLFPVSTWKCRILSFKAESTIYFNYKTINRGPLPNMVLHY